MYYVELLILSYRNLLKPSYAEESTWLGRWNIPAMDRFKDLQYSSVM